MGQKSSSRVPSEGRCRYELEGYSVGQTWEGRRGRQVVSLWRWMDLGGVRRGVPADPEELDTKWHVMERCSK